MMRRVILNDKDNFPTEEDTKNQLATIGEELTRMRRRINSNDKNDFPNGREATHKSYRKGWGSSFRESKSSDAA